jgi:hypothetical protein
MAGRDARPAVARPRRRRPVAGCRRAGGRDARGLAWPGRDNTGRPALGPARVDIAVLPRGCQAAYRKTRCAGARTATGAAPCRPFGLGGALSRRPRRVTLGFRKGRWASQDTNPSEVVARSLTGRLAVGPLPHGVGASPSRPGVRPVQWPRRPGQRQGLGRQELGKPRQGGKPGQPRRLRQGAEVEVCPETPTARGWGRRIGRPYRDAGRGRRRASGGGFGRERRPVFLH